MLFTPFGPIMIFIDDVMVDYEAVRHILPVFVFLFAACVEIGQYFDIVAIWGLANNRLVSIALGRTFSWMDLVCYAIGCVAAFGLDEIIRME